MFEKYVGADWIQLAQDKVKWWAFVDMVTNVSVI